MKIMDNLNISNLIDSSKWESYTLKNISKDLDMISNHINSLTNLKLIKIIKNNMMLLLINLVDLIKRFISFLKLMKNL
jgi:hypothetical protein